MRKHLVCIADTRVLTIPTNHTSIINDILYYTKENKKANVEYIPKKFIGYYNGGVFLTHNENTSPIVADPTSTFFFIEDNSNIPFEIILMDQGYIADSFRMSKSLASNRIATHFVLRKFGLPILKYTISIPRGTYPFCGKVSHVERSTNKKILLNESSDFYDLINKEDVLLCEKYIPKKIQCSYKVLLYLHTPIASILRINDTRDDFTVNLWKKLLVPLSKPEKIDKIIIREFNEQFLYSNEITSSRSITKDEISIVQDTCAQEDIKVSRKNKVVMNNISDIENLAIKASHVLRLGRCEVDIIKDTDSNKYIILDVHPTVNSLWKHVFQTKSVSSLIYQGLCNKKFFLRKFKRIGKT